LRYSYEVSKRLEGELDKLQTKNKRKLDEIIGIVKSDGDAVESKKAIQKGLH
jgi:hypothetical protein